MIPIQCIIFRLNFKDHYNDIRLLTKLYLELIKFLIIFVTLIKFLQLHIILTTLFFLYRSDDSAEATTSREGKRDRKQET